MSNQAIIKEKNKETYEKLSKYIEQQKLRDIVVNGMNLRSKRTTESIEKMNLFCGNFFKKLDDVLYCLDDNECTFLNDDTKSLLLLDSIDILFEIQYFKDTIGDVKNYDAKKYKDEFEKFKIEQFDNFKKFIKNYESIEFIPPHNPNDLYLQSLEKFEDVFKLYNANKLQNKDIIVKILNILFDKERIAKIPKTTINTMQILYNELKYIVENPQREDLSPQELEQLSKECLKELNKDFKTYLKSFK